MASPVFSKSDLLLRVMRWLLVGYAVFLLTVTIYGTLLFPEYARLHPEKFSPNDAWSSEQIQLGLDQLGWPATVPAYVDLARTLLLALVSGGVGLLLLWRPARNWFILYLAFVMLSMTGGDAAMLPVVSRMPALSVFTNFMSGATWQLFFILFFFFPTGQATPRWARWLALSWVILILLESFLPEEISKHPLSVPFFLALVISALASQIYRYFRHSNAVERQQTKWVVSSAGFILMFLVLVIPWAFDSPTGTNLGFRLVIALGNFFLFNTLFALVPLTIGLAIFKKGLWEIDLVIRRTLVYGIITAVLALVYFGGVTLLQRLFTVFTGQQSPLAVVLSTLLIASLFQPLRRAAQNVLDRRFFRSQYDARQILTNFNSVVSKEVELEKITGALVNAAEETMHPEQVSLWMKSKSGV